MKSFNLSCQRLISDNNNVSDKFLILIHSSKHTEENKKLLEGDSRRTNYLGVVACTYNLATLEAEFRNGMGSKVVRV